MAGSRGTNFTRPSLHEKDPVYANPNNQPANVAGCGTSGKSNEEYILCVLIVLLGR